ncbi:MAG: transporter substrate-binding domain-containing protein [Candidatus Omnitrophica bacterium]|nr:transporter substrate-binding domain-containing protein [Candidatus Omnitrophota bacterium]
MSFRSCFRPADQQILHSRNKRWCTALLSAIFAAGILACGTTRAEEAPLQILGVEFIPAYFLKDGKPAGIDTDIASAALKNAGVAFEISTAESWTEAYNATLNGTNRALLTTGYSAERKDSFKWAGPTTKGLYGIFTKGESSPDYPIRIDAAKKLEAIAAVKGWLDTTTLEGLGFKNLVYFDSYNDAVKAFMNDEVKYISSEFFHLTMTLPAGYYLKNVHVVSRYRTVFHYLAFSKDVSDAVVSKVQAEIDKLIANNMATEMANKYFRITLPAELSLGTIQLFSEVSPPCNFYTGVSVDRHPDGSSVEIVNEIQKRNGHVDGINISTWVDSYAVPQYLPNSAIFTAARTPEREKKFQWVGPLVAYRTFFYTLAASGLTVNNLEQAKALKSVATPQEWYTHDFLRKNDFPNIVTTAQTSEQAFKQLISGEVEALFMADMEVEWLAQKAGISADKLVKHFDAVDFDGYIAFSLNTKKETVAQWQANLDAMKADGTFKAIWDKWFSGIEMPK